MDEIKGLCDVEFTDGGHREIPVATNIVDSNGGFLYLVTVEGRIYNWANIRSIKRSK